MKNGKMLLMVIPEVYLILSVIYYWISTANLLNLIAISLIIVLVLQLIFKNKIIGLTIAIIFTLLNLYMILALLSEFHEFPTFNSEAKNLLMFGLLYIGLNITMGIIMLIKYSNHNNLSVKAST